MVARGIMLVFLKRGLGNARRGQRCCQDQGPRVASGRERVATMAHGRDRGGGEGVTPQRSKLSADVLAAQEGADTLV